MKQFNVIYEENKKLDNMFDKLYDSYNPDIIEKNIVELLVEIGELANETRCFKYWSNKKPSEKSVIMDEYADCLIMALYFCGMTNIDLEEEFPNIETNDIIIQFKTLYNIASKLNHQLDKDIIKEILANVINLGKLLNFSDEDVINGCLLKINRNKTRFETGF